MSIRNAITQYGKRGAVGAVLLIAAFFCGFFVRELTRPEVPEDKTLHDMEETSARWTCSMHPQIMLPEPGRCPICGMELIPVGDDEMKGETRERLLTMSREAKALAGIQTSPVERRIVEKEVRMSGKVRYDETRLAYITAWVAGRIDRLYVDYTGITVRKGDHMVSLYSPEILSTQQELLQALRSTEALDEGGLGVIKTTSHATVEAARERLRLWGLTPAQIRAVEERGEPSDHITIHAPVGGVVIHKEAREGIYVEEGSRIYTIADLSRVWVMLDAYESDLEWIRYGQEVEFDVEAYPGEQFHGTIAFIDPVLDDETRTVKVRVNTGNPEGRLKPGMFVRARVYSRLAAAGRVMDPELTGAWICPMHPGVIEKEAGGCAVCGMPLLTAESLGYAAVDESTAEEPLVIPASAPLITGRRAVVYVEMPGTEKPTFEGREIVLGPRAGEYYLVGKGLREGERVVTRGNFKIDSAMQIRAEPSMMMPENGTPVPGAHSRHH